ncbi:MAG: CNNM domain-containing protein [Oscillospiraceae bacterium]
MTTLAWQIILQAALIALNAVFACAEIAVISAKDARIAALAQEGNRRAVRLAQLTSQPRASSPPSRSP